MSTDESPAPSNFAAVIDAFGGPGAFAEAIGIADSHARAMKARNSIPADHWSKVVNAAETGSPARPQLTAVTFELLARLRGDRVAAAGGQVSCGEP